MTQTAASYMNIRGVGICPRCRRQTSKICDCKPAEPSGSPKRDNSPRSFGARLSQGFEYFDIY